MKYLIALCFVIAGSLAQVPCETPQQWEAIVHRYSSYEKTTIVGSFSYDGTNKRERFLSEIVSGGDKKPTDTVYLYNQQTEYIYDVTSKTCTKKTISSSWVNAGVPTNAKLQGTTYVGAPDVSESNIQVTAWSADIASTTVPGEIIKYTSVFSLKTCLPIYSVYESATLGRIEYTFFEITPGIKDPSVFTPPQPCVA